MLKEDSNDTWGRTKRRARSEQGVVKETRQKRTCLERSEFVRRVRGGGDDLRRRKAKFAIGRDVLDAPRALSNARHEHL